MGLKEDIAAQAKAMFDTEWKETEGRVVPTVNSLTLANTVTHFDRATVLYADLDGSTSMVDNQPWYIAAEIYKAFLHAAARVISNQGGVITAYDGDRVMAVFLGDRQTTPAAFAALKINYAVKYVVQPALAARYSSRTVPVIGHKVGIDTSELRAIKTGIRGDNDLTWVGRAANYAAKLTAIPTGPESWVTAAAYEQMHGEVKFYGSPPQAVWTARTWSQMGDQTVYASNWWWTL